MQGHLLSYSSSRFSFTIYTEGESLPVKPLDPPTTQLVLLLSQLM